MHIYSRKPKDDFETPWLSFYLKKCNGQFSISDLYGSAFIDEEMLLSGGFVKKDGQPLTQEDLDKLV